MITKQEALYSLAPTVSCAINHTTGEIVYWDSPEIPQPTPEEISAEQIRLQYTQDRRFAYPSIEEQLDMQYWDAVNGTTTWKDAIAQVKADNPKPE